MASKQPTRRATAARKPISGQPRTQSSAKTERENFTTEPRNQRTAPRVEQDREMTG